MDEWMSRVNKFLHASNMRMAVLVMLPAPRRQQPTTPVQKATKSKKKDTMKRAIMARPISVMMQQHDARIEKTENRAKQYKYY